MKNKGKTMKALLYCMKNEPYITQGCAKPIHTLDWRNPYNYQWRVSINQSRYWNINEKIVAECEIEVEHFRCACVPYRTTNNLGYERFIDNGVYKVKWSDNNATVANGRSVEEVLKDDGVVFERYTKYIDTMLKNDDLQEMCLTPQQLLDYIKLGKDGYLLHIKNLQLIYEDKEKGYRDMSCLSSDKEDFKEITRAPQNMCHAYYGDGETIPQEEFVLISIRPEWLLKILKGEKTIEVRKKVLKEMLQEQKNDK